MTAGALWRLLARHHFRVHPLRWPLLFTCCLASICNTLLRAFQETFFGFRLSRTPLKDGPIFIIGHWRSGTTMLHEMLVLDQRYTFPTTYQCMAPHHFLVSAPWFTKMRFLLPANRPMDNMPAGWDHPQEDEFALCNMGLPSPYAAMAFPDDWRQYQDYLSLENVPADERKRWMNSLKWFLQRLTFLAPKPVILKSPPHLARVKWLLETFPTARFVHIVRDPYAVYSSTIKLWKSLYETQGLQISKYEDLDEYVFSNFERMYDAFERHRSLVDPRRFFELRYEDLVRNPTEQLRQLYEQLQLGGYEEVRPRLEQYLANVRDYKTNKHELDPELRRKIEDRWGPYMRKYGYCQEPAANGACQLEPAGNVSAH